MKESSSNMNGFPKLAKLPEKITITPEEFLTWAQEAIPPLIETRDQVVIALTGPSGGGKTTLGRKIDELNLGASSFFLELDQFLANLSHNKGELLLSPDDWWNLIYDRSTMRTVIQDLFNMGANGGELNLRKVYGRTEFHYDKTVVVPEGKKIIIVPGHDSLDLIQDIYGESPVIQAILMRRMKKSLQAAVVRDIIQEKTKAPESIYKRFIFRLHEYLYQYPHYEELAKQRGAIVIDNNHLPIPWDEIEAEEGEAIQEMINKILRGLI